jgi:hypothetical protein
VVPLPPTEQSVALTVAVDRFLDGFRDDPTTRNTYAETLTRLPAAADDRLPTAELTPFLSPCNPVIEDLT